MAPDNEGNRPIITTTETDDMKDSLHGHLNAGLQNDDAHHQFPQQQLLRRASAKEGGDDDDSNHLLSAAAAESIATMENGQQQYLEVAAPIPPPTNPRGESAGSVTFSPMEQHQKQLDQEGRTESSPLTQQLSEQLYSPSSALHKQPKYTSSDNILNSPRPTKHHHHSPSESSFDFDASQNNKRKGTGYLASQLSLSTPTDVFASGCTLLQLCAIGNLQAVQNYITNVFNNVNFRDYDRRTALHVAASEGHLDVVKYLVNKGANVNRSDRWGGSPLDE